jgi:hypothetical protein
MSQLFFAANFFEDVFLEDAFFEELFFLGGATFAPDLRASLNAIATACLRLFTFARPPDFNWPCLYSCITFLTFAFPLADVFLCDALFFAAMILLLFAV